MACGHFIEGAETAFTVDASRITFGRGCIRELGDRARAHGLKRALLFTDVRVGGTAFFESARNTLKMAGIDVVVYDAVKVEPTDASLSAAIAFAKETRADGFVSVGGGSVMDTCKAANLYASHPADFLDYVNAPIGQGKKPPGALAPHIACPTTSGTGSEVTGIAVFDLLSLGAKTGIASPALRPTEALVDPDCTATLPAEVVASSGFDVLSHALESFTAKPFSSRSASSPDSPRPMSQGRNPWSDIGCAEALRLLGKYFERAVKDAHDFEAREKTMWAATLAGIAFGNSGVHVPHAMSYSVAGLVRDFHPAGYPAEESMVPHGMSVIVNAPSVFRVTAPLSPERHLQAAAWLGADTRDASNADAGEILAGKLASLMSALGMPNGLTEIGYGEGDLDALVRGAAAQKRLLSNAPLEVDATKLRELFAGAMRNWS